MRALTTLTPYQNKWAVVTGAARKEGLGYAMARELAAHGVHVILVDILAQELAARHAELTRDFPSQFRTVTCDLSEAGPYASLEEAVADLEVELLVCNHMFTPRDTPEILDMPLDTHHRMMEINARAYINLIHMFGKAMRQRRHGGIVIVSSGAGVTGAPYTGAYAANKAYQIALGESLWYELRQYNVDVLVVAAGLMNTQGDALSKYPQWMICEPDVAASETLAALGKVHFVVPGRANRAVSLIQTRVMSRRARLLRMGKYMSEGLSKRS